MELKKCSDCKKELPKTTDYFSGKISKYKLKNGEYGVCNSLRHICIDCHKKKSVDFKRKRRIKELGCTLENYYKYYCADIAFKKLKYKELKGLNQSKRAMIRKKIDSGYNFTTIEQYQKDVEINKRQAQLKHRKYEYGTLEILTNIQKQDKYSEIITKARIANHYKIPVSKLPKEIIESKRLIIQLKRQSGQTHSSKRKNHGN